MKGQKGGREKSRGNGQGEKKGGRERRWDRGRERRNKCGTRYAYCESPVSVLTTFLTMLGGLISSFRMFDSVARGNPLSSISSNN